MRLRIVGPTLSLLLLHLVVTPHGNEGNQHTTSPCRTVESEVDIQALLKAVFTQKPQELLQQSIIDQPFVDAIKDARIEVCDDHLLDVITTPGAQPTIVFDSSLLGVFALESQSIVLGQYLLNEKVDRRLTDPFQIHGELMRSIGQQDLVHNRPAIRMEDVVERFLGRKIDIEPILDGSVFQQRQNTLFANSLYFIVFHELCHIVNRARSAPSPSQRQAQSRGDVTQGELDADSCAINIINQDERRAKSSPISFFSVLLVTSTQRAIAVALERSGAVLRHPSPLARINNAYRLMAEFLDSAPDTMKYRSSVNAAYRHFLATAEK